MSADNVILVSKWDDGYRVAEGSASLADDIHHPYSDYQRALNVQFFGDNPPYPTLEEARKAANDLENDIGYVEYGIEFLDLKDEYGKCPSRGKYPEMTLEEANQIINDYWLIFEDDAEDKQ